MSQVLGSVLPLQLENNGYFGTNKNLLKQLKSNLTNLLRTRKGERLHQPNFGCDIHKFVFEQFTDETVENAYTSVVDAVDVWMPFLEVLNVNLENTVSDIDAQQIKMTVIFRLRTNQNITDSLVLTF